MADSEQIVLIDIKSKLKKCWSLNPWKIRMVLDYKGISYRTQWLEYPELKETIAGNHPPAEDGRYTSPTIILPDGRYIMDSQTIAQELEKLYPSAKSLQVDAPLATEMRELATKTLMAMIGVFLPASARVLEPTSERFLRDRYEPLMGDFDTLAKDKGGEAAWQAAKPLIQQVTALLEKDASGPFFAGEELQYADFVWAGFLLYVKSVAADQWDGLFAAAGGEAVHAKLLEAVAPYTQQDA